MQSRLDSGYQATGQYFQQHTFHWDGDQLLFSTNQNGQVDDLKLGNRGDFLPLDAHYTSLAYWDRDFRGFATSEHGNGCKGEWDVPTVATL
jgi:hypothetical protein